MGTIAWKNWRAARGRKQQGAPQYEVLLYSDASVRGGPLVLGPYSILNTLADPSPMMPAMAMRGEHLVKMPDLVDPQTKELLPTNSKAYHGGTAADEMAALLSLSCGVRCRVGGTSRDWTINGNDPYGQPVFWDMHPLRRPGSSGQELLPRITTRKVDLNGIQDLLLTFPEIAESKAIALVRAARMYSNALWWSNEDPNFAWIQFVGAIETAANTRRSGLQGGAAIKALEELEPKLWAALEAADGSTKQDVAEIMVPNLKAQKKFVSFVADYNQGPPETRPAEFQQLDWLKLDSHMQVIYGHRSNALHDGTPFPAPMLQKPYGTYEEGWSERPLGITASSGGSSWDAHEYPMTLQTFEELVRGCLVEWWKRLS
ncbi:hypothetical protein OCL88_15845 [Paenarthrobacter sp. PAE-2]|uniref:hypothetical protein n=1 Tax=Paenarthrobacter sp. PAE-2 TaxID=2982532 RepID=UPI00222F068F|nr:hypothetical protein [Paenarthrobacter sp. PAE-2]MCW3767952.1 hypothetical protein [Paenarthrobacter sp. PAE-2]